ncbi:YIP1 family protein [Pseudomonas fluorescens]|uniref:Inner membrane protein YohC n=1 Tax=Pseudomonas fluorescens TaxID=294 RepID=A0A5E7BYW4_PSEFL|nr:YIP1 family protein [Pseudomonas fluorescens]VVN95127.1 Inner membrane protein YohC [Pseudomonas fluorescens]VVP93483.1 Inner membrane protein YohC [Pseudomonas fluorescens]
MSAPIVKLFTQPNFAWTDIRKEEEAHQRHYLAHLLLLALIPAVCLFIGTTYVGWSLAENEIVKLSSGSALQLCGLLYVTIVAGLYPSRWLAITVLGAASLYSTFLLFIGLPTFMHERKEQGLLNAACVWGVGLLVLVTILVEMILIWFNVLTPEYLRATVS